MVSVTEALGHVTSYTYDALGNLTSETDALGNTVKYTYTPEGWLKTVTDAEGRITRYTYDRTGNVLTADHAGEQTETNTYNELGLLTTVTAAEGDTLYQYDEAGRLISVTQPNGETVSYTYDSHGNRATMTYPNGRTVTYTYDDMNRLVAVKGVDGATTKYSYDALGRRIATDGVKEDTTYAYDEVGNLVSQTTTGTYDLALSYAYDLSGRMTNESRTENGTTLTSVFTYDPLGQLTSFTRSDGQSESYAYDPAGNMTAKTQNGAETRMTYNAANQLMQSVTGGETTKYTYDANGNLTRSENAAGVRSYTYNALNLLESFTREDGYTESYSYNANRLLSEIRTGDGLTTALTWDILYGDGVVISAAQNGKQTSYTYGMERISAITGNTRTEYVYDGRGSVAAEVSYNDSWYTIGGGLARKNVISKSYSPFGELLTEQTSGFGYNGEYYNAATGMIYLRARFYEPELNRFSQKDTLRGSIIDPAGLNRYLYCQSDPVNFADYNGLQMVAVGLEGGGRGGKIKQPAIINNVATSISSAVSAASIVKKTVKKALTPQASPSSTPSPTSQPTTPVPGPGPEVANPSSENGNCSVGQHLRNTWNSVNGVFTHIFGAEHRTTYQYDTVTTIFDYLMGNSPATNTFNYLSPINVERGIGTSNTITDSGDSTKPVTVYSEARSDDPSLSSVGIDINTSILSLEGSLGLSNTGLSFVLHVDDDTDYSLGCNLDLTKIRLEIEFTSTIEISPGESAFNYYNVSVNPIIVFLMFEYVQTGNPDVLVAATS